MHITRRFDPFTLLGATIFDDLNRFLEPTQNDRQWVPRVDVSESPDSIVITAELPGVDPASIEISAEDGLLTIGGTRSLTTGALEDDAESPAIRRREIYEGAFARKIRLPKEVDLDAVSAKSANGMVEVTVPKQPTVAPRNVTVVVQR